MTDDLDWKAAAIASADHNCLTNLEYVAHLGAPGTGQSWDCSVCGKHFHRRNADAPAVPFSDLDPSAFILDPSDCI